MSWPYEDCECVQGIEHFIDPRLYLPTFESRDPGDIELPIWEKKLREEEEAAALLAQDEEDPKDVTIDSERVLKLIVHGTGLINQGYVHLTAHQINSYYVQLDSLDRDWRDNDCSLIFTNVNSKVTVTVPIIKLGVPTIIPSSVLTPGKLCVAAIAIRKLTDYQVITAEALELHVYDPKIGRPEWTAKPDYDVYFYYQSLIKKLLAEVEACKKAMPIQLRDELTLTLSPSDHELTECTVKIPYHVILCDYYVTFHFDPFRVKGLKQNEKYVGYIKLPLQELGVTNVSLDEFKRVGENLDVLVQHLGCENADHTIGENFTTIDFTNMPQIKFQIETLTRVDCVSIQLNTLTFYREPRD